MNQSTLRWTFVITVLAAAGFIYATAGRLPDPLAAHFATDGSVNNSMSRGAYCALMTGLTLLIPLLVFVFQVWLPRRLMRFINIPNRNYWFETEERKAQVIDYLERHGLTFGLVPPLFFAAMHWLLIDANSQVPPRLDNSLFLLLTGGFVVLVLSSVVMLALHFRRAA